jgi:hypothetical protein
VVLQGALECAFAPVLAAAVAALCTVGEDELRHSLGLAAHTTGKGKVTLDPNTRPIEVYMCSVVS